MATELFVAQGEKQVFLNLAMANRHGLIAGATGTGKTVSLQVLAEAMSSRGVPVFMADVKGDLSGMGKSGAGPDGAFKASVAKRIEEFKLKDFTPAACPVCFLDVFGKIGHPLRTTVSDIGPLLLSRLLGLNDVQEGTLNIVFRIADEKGWLLLDMKDLRAMLDYAAKNAAQYATPYGNISSASVGAIQRGLLTLETQGGDKFLGEPAFDINDLLRTQDGRGVVTILAADVLLQSPALYSTLLLWLLSELYENLPEAGDLPQPKLAFFFDEAHLLFNTASKVLLEKIEQITRLIRSKGVGVYFVTQSPLDIPDAVLGQLGNRVQHALRAYTPRDQKAVKTAAETFRPNPKFKTEDAITELAVGEALISFLDDAGRPGIVERAIMLPPHSQIGPVTADERAALTAASGIAGKYDKAIDRESAFEILLKETEAADAEKKRAAAQKELDAIEAREKKEAAAAEKAAAAEARAAERAAKAATPKTTGRRGDSIGTTIAKTAARELSRQVTRSMGKSLMRGVLGSLLK